MNFKFINKNLIYQNNFISGIHKENFDYACKLNNKKDKEKEKEIVSSSVNIKEINVRDNKDFPKNISDVIECGMNNKHKFFKYLNYRLLFIHCFHCLLTKNKKIQYAISSKKMKIIKEKLDICNYLNLQKKFDLLLIQINKKKIKNNEFCK